MKVQLIGRFRMVDSGGSDVTPKSQKACCIIAYFLLTGQKSIRRDLLTSLLWSESDEDHARSSLRQTLRKIRIVSNKQKTGFLTTDKTYVTLHLNDFETDIRLANVAFLALNIQLAMDLLSGKELELLSGHNSVDTVFDSWLRVERENFSSDISLSISNVLKKYQLTVEDQKRLAEIALRLDPFAEEAVRAQIEFHAENEDYKSARDVFERYRAELADHYELQPSDELRDLVEHIQEFNSGARARLPLPTRGREPVSSQELLHAITENLKDWDASTRPVKNRSSGPAIAVLSKMVGSQSSELEYIGGAFCDDLVATMSRFSEWTVVSPNLTEHTTDGETAENVARSLAEQSLDYLAHCEIEVTLKEDLHVSILLFECKTAEMELRLNYEIKSQNRLASLNDISCKIAARIQQAVVTSKLHRIAENSPKHVEAYDAWLEGHYLFFQWRQDTEEKKIALFNKAIELDPGFPSSYSSLSAVLNSRWFVLPGCQEDEADRRTALHLSQMAVKLDPLDSKHHVNLAWSHLLSNRHDCAEIHFGIAINLNPANPNVLMAAALANAFSGNHAVSADLSSRAFELNSTPQDWYYGYEATIAFLNGQFEACVEAVARVPDIFPDIMGWSAAANYRLGRTKKAEKDLVKFYYNLRQSWAGPDPPDEKSMRDWFIRIFPIRNSQQREVLASSIQALT